MMTAELHDGTTLEFPDGTNPSVIQAVVKRHLNVAPAPPAAAAQSAEAVPAENEGYTSSISDYPGVLG